jgi:glycosyltransferase 2 family protein
VSVAGVSTEEGTARARPLAAARDRLPGRRQGPRLFATPADEPRARRAGDIIVLVTSGVLLAAVSVTAVPPPGFGQALEDYLASFPDTLDGLWAALADGLMLLALLFLVGAALRRRMSIVRDQLVAILVALRVGLTLGRVVVGSWPDVWESLWAAEPPAWYPSPRIAVPGAVILTAAPHLALPARRLGRRMVFLAMVAVAMLGATTPLGAVAGFLVATMAAAAVHLAFGSSEGRPGLGLVRGALAELGVPTRSVGAADRQQAGVFLVQAVSEDGDPLVVKVYGRDAHDTALVSTLWRMVWYRGASAPVRLGRLEQVEHEAFVTLLARQHGVATDEVVTAGPTADDDALLVLRRRGRVLSDVSSPSDGADVVAPVWELVDRLHGGDIAHGQLDEEHLLLLDRAAGAGPVLGAVDFRGATAAAGDVVRRADEVQALVTTVALAGEEAAVAGAVAALGPDGLAATLPYLQPSVLTPYQRRQVKDLDLDLDSLRTRAAEAVGAEPPDLQQLRRITVRSLVNVVLPAVAVIALISGLAGLDLAEMSDILAHANWWLVAFGVLFTQVPRLTQAVSTLGAAPIPLPLGPVYALQLAICYVNLAIPSAAARLAVNIRFFQRHGVPPSGAVTAGALDGFSGFVVQALLLTGLLAFTSVSLDLQVGDAVDDATHLLVLVAVIAALAISVLLVVKRLRRLVLEWGRRIRTDAMSALRGLRSPRRLALLFGGNLATELLFATSLGIFTRALGYPVGLDELLLVNISVALLSGILPVPGGIGVTEGGLTYGLVQFGLPEEVALASALLYRLSSFYLPPIWGFFAMRWLERNDHL